MRYKIKSQETIFREFFKVERVSVSWEQFDGTMGQEHIRYMIRRGDSAGIIPVCKKDGRIILIKQFRFPAVREDFDGFLWEIPAGMVDKAEEPARTARRELFEEIGIEIDEVIHLLSFYLSPGAMDEMFHLFFAEIESFEKIGSVGGNQREHENLKIGIFDKKELFEMIKSSEIIDGKTVASLLYYLCFSF